jgi:uncharacterized membrane protein
MSQGAVRHVYLDQVRGLAVLIMIEAHVLDSWTRASDRAHPGFGYAMMLGGMGAPLFLFLAGVAVALSAQSKFRKTGDQTAGWRAVQRRGWQISRSPCFAFSRSFWAVGRTRRTLKWTS